MEDWGILGEWVQSFNALDPISQMLVLLIFFLVVVGLLGVLASAFVSRE